jgi:hypothetical protein
VKRSSIIFEINDEVGKTMLIFECTECRDTEISYIAARSLVEPLEACRPKEGLKCIAPKQPEALGRAVRRAPHVEAFIPDVNSRVPRTDWRGYKSTPTLEGHTSRAPNKVGRAVDIPRYCET